jgi:hypothetical protein
MTRGGGPPRREELAHRSALAARRAAAEMAHRPGDRAEAGDLFVLRQSGDLPVEWAVLESRPAMGDGPAADESTAADGSTAAHESTAAPPVLLAVPADANPLAGSADFELPSDSPAAPLTLRCGFGVWLAETELDLAHRTGRLGEEALRRARRVQAAAMARRPLAATSATPAQREVDADPEYQEWVEKVLVPARRAVIEGPGRGIGAVPAFAARAPVAAEPSIAGGAGAAAPPVAAAVSVVAVAAASVVAAVAAIGGSRGETRRRWRLERPYALAAALLLLLSLGLGIAVAWQAHRLRELAAEQRRGELLLRSTRESSAAAERRASAERQRLSAALGQAAATARGGTGGSTGGGTVSSGDKGQRAQAPAADEPVVNLPIVWLAADEALRGQPGAVKIPADARLVALALDLGTAPALPRYRLELRRSSGQRVWRADGLRKTGAMELTVALPRRLLRPGSYSLRLYGPAAADRQPLATYSLAVE